jgi:hypothetical protein
VRSDVVDNTKWPALDDRDTLGQSGSKLRSPLVCVIDDVSNLVCGNALEELLRAIGELLMSIRALNSPSAATTIKNGDSRMRARTVRPL